MKRILVACGTGIATSTVVAKKLEESMKARGVDAKIDQCKVTEVAAKASAYDVIVSTTEVLDSGGKPVVRALSFLTGVGMDADVEKILRALGCG
jgi:PTS system galactitol-specific IIB component